MQTIKSFYNQVNYPNPSNYKIKQWFSPFAEPGNQINGNILVIGCGTVEANLVAYHQPSSAVYGIDFSKSSIAISKSIKRKYKINNLSHTCGDFFDCVFSGEKFDVVIASGVLHHMPDVDTAINKTRSILNTNGRFSGMVYSTNRPARIRTYRDFFIKNNYTVEDVKKFLSFANDDWFEIHQRTDDEICDTWLNPYFTEYSEDKIKTLLEKHGFRDVVTKYDGYLGSKLLFSAWKEAA